MVVTASQAQSVVVGFELGEEERGQVYVGRSWGWVSGAYG